MSASTHDHARKLGDLLTRGMSGFRTCSKADVVHAWQRLASESDPLTDQRCDEIEDYLHSSGFKCYPGIADCRNEESFRICREGSLVGEVHRMFFEPNRLEDHRVVEIVERLKNKWQPRYGAESRTA